MPKRNKNRRNISRGSRSTRIGRGPNMGSCRIRGTGYPFYVSSSGAGTGCLYNQESQLSLTAATNVYLDPFAIGGRLFQMASIFEQYRVNSCTFRYQPIVGPTGIASTPAGATNTPAYSNRLFCLEFFADPAVSAPSFIAGMSSQHVLSRTSDKATLRLGRGFQPAAWLYASTTGASPSAIDKRTACFGLLGCNFQDTSSTAADNFGLIEVEWDVTFRGPIFYGNPLGLQVADQRSTIDDDEKKTNNRPSAPSTFQSSILAAKTLISRR